MYRCPPHLQGVTHRAYIFVGVVMAVYLLRSELCMPEDLRPQSQHQWRQQQPRVCVNLQNRGNFVCRFPPDYDGESPVPTPHSGGLAVTNWVNMP